MTSAIPLALPGQAVPQDPAAADTGAGSVPGSGPAKSAPGQPRVWLPAAAAGLCVLAGAAAAVSYAAQYRLVYSARHLVPESFAPAGMKEAWRCDFS